MRVLFVLVAASLVACGGGAQSAVDAQAGASVAPEGGGGASEAQAGAAGALGGAATAGGGSVAIELGGAAGAPEAGGSGGALAGAGGQLGAAGSGGTTAGGASAGGASAGGGAGSGAGAANGGAVSVDPECTPSNNHALALKCVTPEPARCATAALVPFGLCTGAGECSDKPGYHCTATWEGTACADGRHALCDAGTCGTDGGAKCKLYENDTPTTQYCPCEQLGAVVKN